jgi:hypothetical protein
MYPEMVQTLVNGGYYHTSCPECGISMEINGQIMVNTPKGIVLIPSGPPEKLTQEISDKLQHNMDNLDKKPLLKKQSEYNKEFEKYMSGEKEKKKKKRFGLF